MENQKIVRAQPHGNSFNNNTSQSSQQQSSSLASSGKYNNNPAVASSNTQSFRSSGHVQSDYSRSAKNNKGKLS